MRDTNKTGTQARNCEALTRWTRVSLRLKWKLYSHTTKFVNSKASPPHTENTAASGVFKIFINQVKPGGAFRSVCDTETRPHLDSPAAATQTEAPPPHPHPHSHRSMNTPTITDQINNLHTFEFLQRYVCVRACVCENKVTAAAAGQSGKGALDQKKISSFLLGAEERQGCVGGARCVGGAQRQPIATVSTTKTSRLSL